jgi:hypothetical protein
MLANTGQRLVFLCSEHQFCCQVAGESYLEYSAYTTEVISRLYTSQRLLARTSQQRTKTGTRRLKSSLSSQNEHHHSRHPG